MKIQDVQHLFIWLSTIYGYKTQLMLANITWSASLLCWSGKSVFSKLSIAIHRYIAHTHMAGTGGIIGHKQRQSQIWLQRDCMTVTVVGDENCSLV